MAAFILHHDKISQIPMHPSRMQESISINISEAGFEAMKNDPEYEAWVLNDLRTGWAQPDRWAALMRKHHRRLVALSFLPLSSELFHNKIRAVHTMGNWMRNYVIFM